MVILLQIVYVAPLAKKRTIRVVPGLDSVINEVAMQSSKSYSWILNRILYLYLSQNDKLEKYNQLVIDEYFNSRALDD